MGIDRVRRGTGEAQQSPGIFLIIQSQSHLFCGGKIGQLEKNSAYQSTSVTLMVLLYCAVSLSVCGEARFYLSNE